MNRYVTYKFFALWLAVFLLSNIVASVRETQTRYNPLVNRINQQQTQINVLRSELLSLRIIKTGECIRVSNSVICVP